MTYAVHLPQIFYLRHTVAPPPPATQHPCAVVADISAKPDELRWTASEGGRSHLPSELETAHHP